MNLNGEWGMRYSILSVTLRIKCRTTERRQDFKYLLPRVLIVIDQLKYSLKGWTNQIFEVWENI